MHNILVPVDGSLHALKAAHIACDFAQKYEGSIYLLYVLPTEKPAKKLLSLAAAKSYDAELKSQLQAQEKMKGGLASKASIRAVGEQILAQAAKNIRHQGVIANKLPLAGGEIVPSILDHIKTIDANVVVLGSRGVSDIQSAAMGSVSQAVFQQADCTCIAVK